MLHSQLQECPPEMFDQVPGSADGDCFLSVLLYEFFENVLGHGVITDAATGELKALPKKCREMQLFVQKKYAWYECLDEGYTIVEE